MENDTIEKKGKQKIDWWVYTVPALVVLTLIQYALVHMSQSGVLRITLFYLAPLITAVLAIIFLIFAVIRSFIKRPFFNKWRIGGFIGLLLLCFTGFLYHAFPSQYDDKPSKIAFRLPLDTAITVFWGGGTEQQNYHVVAPEQRWAYDLLVFKNNKSFSGDSSKPENYYCYGLPVLSPADGKIVSISDTDPDSPIGIPLGHESNPGGNQIVIQVAPKEFLFLCHLKPKSINVKVGDHVKQGQELALVGNSGNTSEPHIHVHLQDTEDLFIGQGIPLYFHNYRLNGKLVEKGIPTGGFNDDDEFVGQTVQHVK